MSGITHYEGCWHDPKHHACALTEIKRLDNLIRLCIDEKAGALKKIKRLRLLLWEANLAYEGDPHFDPDQWIQRIRKVLGDE